MDRPTLLEARQTLRVAIRASEEWSPSYKQAPRAFSALLTHEAALETAVAEYLSRLAHRAPGYVDWKQVAQQQVKAAANPVDNQDDPEWDAESGDLASSIMDIIIALVVAGGEAGQQTYGIDIGINNLSDSVLKAAREQVANLVKGVTVTTRNLIRESIAQSITRGENLAQSADRLMSVLNNPARAELIAQTESVRAYQSGLRAFAEQTGAKTKTFEALVGACQLCSPSDGKTIPMNDEFDLGDPPVHPRCRCSVIYNY